MTEREEFEELLEKLCGDIYEVGYSHGSNAFRLFRGEKAIMVDKGWYPIFYKILVLWRGNEVVRD